jgi:ParB family chromosome partitioning protein
MPTYTSNKPSSEWYTPKHIIDKAREVLGHIDLDPASCEYAQKTVQARMYFDKERNGLDLQWRGRVWLNPPYGRGIRHWINKLVDEYENGEVEQAITIVNNATDVGWFQPFWDYSICFPTGRVYFERPGSEADSPAQGSAIVYLGKNNGRFAGHFADLGPVFEYAGEDLRKFRIKGTL